MFRIISAITIALTCFCHLGCHYTEHVISLGPHYAINGYFNLGKYYTLAALTTNDKNLAAELYIQKIPNTIIKKIYVFMSIIVLRAVNENQLTRMRTICEDVVVITIRFTYCYYRRKSPLQNRFGCIYLYLPIRRRHYYSIYPNYLEYAIVCFWHTC